MTVALAELFVPALFVVFIALVVALAVWQWQKEKARGEALRALAAARGWSYTAKDAHDIPRRLRGFEPFAVGHTRYASNILRGGPEAAFEVFDYHYAVTTSTGKTTTTTPHYHRVAVVGMPIPVPDLVIRDEHLGHKLFDALGGEDIDFESHEFSRRFWVRCSDRRLAYDVIHTGMMEFLLGLRGWVWQWRGRTLLVYGTGKMTPADVDRLLSLCGRFRDLVPRHLVAASPTA